MGKRPSATTSTKHLIRNARIVEPTRIISGDIALEDGVIAYIGEPLKQTTGYTAIDGKGCYALPGLVDIHCHGGAMFDLTAGRYDSAKKTFDPSLAAYPEALGRVAASMAANGVTSAMLATVAASVDRLREVMGELAKYIESDRNGRDGSAFFGGFVEGTFILRPEFAGAQNSSYFQKPATEIFDRINDAARGHVRYVNVVPEYGEPTLKLTEYLSGKGVLVGAGHSKCPADQFLQAVDRGLKIAVHLTNGPTGTSFKPFNGGDVLEAVLTSRKVYAEQIADGYHINPAYVMDILRRKGADRVVAVTDAMFPTGAQNIGEFEVSGIKGKMADNSEYLRVTEKENTLFGSVLTMRKAFANWVSWLTREMPGIWNEKHAPIPTEAAVQVATQLCSANPATVVGMYEPAGRRVGQDMSKYVGSLEVGKRADVTLLKLIGSEGNYKADVAAVFVKGEKVVG